jgi:hypothetical protein
MVNSWRLVGTPHSGKDRALWLSARHFFCYLYASPPSPNLGNVLRVAGYNSLRRRINKGSHLPRMNQVAFLFVSLWPATTAAGGPLDDFSNDHATDLGPRLALFGDSMTKQYLSEMTSALDYIIFALAPIGIVKGEIPLTRHCSRKLATTCPC